jgi:hypothetical protein
MKKQNSNYNRLTVHLFNTERKKDFQTTHTYEDIKSESEAIRIIWELHSLPSDNAHDMSRKVIKAVYNSKPITAFKNEAVHTKNGWVLK